MTITCQTVMQLLRGVYQLEHESDKGAHKLAFYVPFKSRMERTDDEFPCISRLHSVIAKRPSIEDK